jgi:cytoskeletal protein RodZ
MMGLGTLLEKARLRQGLTIEEMSDRTKIKPQFLQAIEEEEYHLLPGEAYVKPFIRTYAKALGLDDEIMGDVEGPAVISEDVFVDAGIRERRERAKRARRRRFLVRVITALLVLSGAAYLFFRLLNV